jgi:NAD-dependent DNA ligase
MAELHSNIYYKHSKPEIMQKLDSLFSDCEGDENNLIRIATQINQDDGAEFARDLLSKVEEPEYDIDAESLEKVDGYSVAHLVHGSAGDEVVKNIIKFLYALIPDIHAQAWGCGDDDPWEFWLKYENNSLVRKDDEPFIDEDDDQEILNTVYAWWHETMPAAISEGLLNEDREIDLEDEHVVFTGKMECGTREEMEELARELGSNVQKSITKKSTLLVVGKRPGESKLAKARDLNIRIISEAEYNEIIDATIGRTRF